MQIRHFCALALSAATLTLIGGAGVPGKVSVAPPGLGANVPPVASVEANKRRITILRTYPDLAGTVEFIQWTNPCNQFSIYVSVENRGPVPTGAFTVTGTMALLEPISGGMNVAYYRAPDFSMSFGPLPAMSSDGRLQTFRIPQTLVDDSRVGNGRDIDFGRLGLTANIDPTSQATPNGAVRESDESNNTGTFNNRLTCTEP